MKTSLPKESESHRGVIHEIRDKILASYKDKIAFIILFGSFARGNWVYDYYTEDNRDYEFASDYDFLVITKSGKQGGGYQAMQFKDGIDKKLKEFKRPYKSHTPTIIVESVDRVNQELESGRYFFSDIKKEGVLLYDSGEFALKDARELTGREIRKIAKADFEQWFKSGNEFLIDCNNALTRESYNKSAFYLHQAVESFLSCALLVITGYKPKSHDIEELNRLCASQSNKFLEIFPIASKKGKEAFGLLKAAYIDARYSKNYKIAGEQLVYLIGRVEILRDIVKVVCEERIGSLG